MCAWSIGQLLNLEHLYVLGEITEAFNMSICGVFLVAKKSIALGYMTCSPHLHRNKSMTPYHDPPMVLIVAIMKSIMNHEKIVILFGM